MMVNFERERVISKDKVFQHYSLYNYWLAKRGQRAMPAHCDLSAADIPVLLPYLLILGKTKDQYRYRLVGSAVVKAVGHDATWSTPGSYLTTPEQAIEAKRIFERVFSIGSPVFATGVFIFRSGDFLATSMLTLPLSDDGVNVNKTISTLATRFHNDLHASPDWLKGIPVRIDSVVDVGGVEELKTLCLEWEQHSSDLDPRILGHDNAAQAGEPSCLHSLPHGQYASLRRKHQIAASPRKQ